ncbi:elongation factor P hydroxylase [Maricurvus nonylphenolicus]|uniref:elongation factor P hydroxylase n=1 Tax=Maricurvus nonylphenolicus TaxID=1008307 RepID=UPI0036F3507D
MTAMEKVQPVVANHCAADLVQCFNRTFDTPYNTRLVGGGEEPIYLPADQDEQFHRIVFTHDYFASALHEIAHWCVAGDVRRQQVDYGYWYAPDGRSQEQQQEFEQVEIKPQAMEWIFSVACGYHFRVSADNLEAGLGASESFKANIYQQVLAYCQQGLPVRPQQFALALAKHYGVENPFAPHHYQLENL